MSQLNYMDKLLDGVEVEWKELWQVTTWDKKFNAVEREKQPNVIKYHYFLAKDLKSLALENGDVKLLTTNSSNIWTSEELAGDKISEGEIIAIPWGGNPIIQYYKGKFVTTDNRIATSTEKNILSNKFIYYYLLSKIDLVSSFYRGSGIKHPSMYDVLHISIPIPPLNIQAKIVRFLDAFTELTAELTAELVARKQQYTYYREQLLTFEEGKVEHLPMGTEGIGQFVRGKGLQKKDFTETGVGCIHYGQVYTHYDAYAYSTKTFVSTEFAKKARKAQYGNLIIATTSENDEDVCKAVAWLGNEEIAISNDACIYKHTLNPKFVSYFFQTEQFQKQKIQYITGTKVRRVNADSLAKIKIPVPSLAEQKRIVTILDKFDALTTSLTEGLPREIELRQQQYEYYRELLLSFPKAEVADHD